MANGYLTVNVYDKNISKPVGNATVVVSGENYKQSFVTDNNGKTPLIELSAPDKKYSLYPQKEVRPYSIYSVEVSKDGYEKKIINGVQVLPDETSIQNVYLDPTVTTFSTEAIKSASIADPEVINLPPHSLWEEEKTGSVSNVVEGTTDMRVYPYVLIPEYVIVHNGAPSNSAANYYVPFIDYIKNVASGEIYSTWPVESLRANIYAIISFTLNRVFTEWYISRGYNFTITALPTYDQSYTYDRTIFKTISDIVDDIFMYYIKIPGRDYPFFAQYDDGINVNNAGWLSQWGSKYLADQGYNALQILRYYYVDDLTLVSANEVEGLPSSFPGYNLTIGSCGEPVRQVQIMLNAISNNYPAIPKVSTDGVYSDNTGKSVKVFQQVFDIPNTGIVDFTTWYKLSYIYVAVIKMQKGV